MKETETITWRPWGPEAFEAARKDSRPIFLSISATWCHWCHVMDGESFDHPEVIRRLNRDFIPVRVDSDKRPDINNRYNMGGWPTVAILDPDGGVIIGETYLPTSQLLEMLSSIEKNPRERPEHAPRPPSAAPPEKAGLSESMIQAVAGLLEQAFDPEFGGFGGPPKFPQPWVMDLLLHLHHRTRETKFLRMATLTLDTMRETEIFDQVDGGFFRYATRGDWDHPHYEKLLEVNAHLISIYLEAYRLTGEVPYRATAQGILDYLFTTLAVEDGPWFCGSQNAEAEYYALPEEARLAAEPPARDRTLYTDQNAAAASALLKAYQSLGETKYLDAGLKLIEFLWGHCHRADKGLYHYDDGTLSLPGYLSDPVRMMAAVMDAYESTGSGRYLDRARDLAAVMERQLWDAERGGFWDLPEAPGREGVLKVRIKPFVDNAAAAMALTRLAHLSGQKGDRERAGAVLEYLSTVFKMYKHHAAPFALALERFLTPPVHIVVVGKRGAKDWGELVKAAHRARPPWKVVIPLDEEEDRSRLESFGYPSDRGVEAYVCIGTTCLPPVARPNELIGLLEKDQSSVR